MTLLYQLVSTFIIGFACAMIGLQYVLPSSTLKLFSSENTPLDRIMSETEQSLMGSLSSASTLIVTPFCGYLLDTLGRKRTLILFFLPQLLSWLVLVTTFRVEAFIFAMFLCGLSGSVTLVAFVYVNEYCDPFIRGRMSTAIVIFNGVGMLLSYLFGGLFEYRTMIYTGLTLYLVSLVLICCLTESPMYLMKKGLEEEAAQSIAFFKGTKSYSEKVIKEMDNVRRLINDDVEIRITPEEENFNPKKNNSKAKVSIRKSLSKSKLYNYCKKRVAISKNGKEDSLDDISVEIWKLIEKIGFKSRSSRRALVSLLILYTLCIFQGLIVVQVYAGPLFEAAVPSITATLTTVLFATIAVVAGCFGAYLSDKVGRRILLINASVATGVFCVIAATNIQFHWAPKLFTAVLIYVYTFTYTLGAGTVPYVLLGEVFLPEIKGFATSLCMEWSFLCNFFMLYMCVPVFNAYGLAPLFFFFAGLSFFTAFFSYFYLPETKNVTTDVIQTKFLERIKS